jgi:hypothetical protein
MPPPTIWIVGDWQHVDFAPALAWVRGRACCEDFGSASAALDKSSKICAPSAILLVQSRPGQISHTEVERLHRRAPLARLVALVGPWCEGELRSGQPWPGVVRIPWRAWPAQLPRELSLVGAEGSISTRWARTATETDRLGRQIGGLARDRCLGGIADVRTTSRGTYESLQGALQTLGICSQWQSPGGTSQLPASNLVLVDGWETLPPASSSEPTGTQPHILLLHFPRPDDCSRATALGIDAILAQPLLLTDLAATLDRLLDRPVAGARESVA